MIDFDAESDLPKGVVPAALAAAAVAVIASGWSYVFDGQAPYGDDHSAHLALMMHLGDLFRTGVTDLWWNQSNLGLPLFMAYQPLPGLVSGAAAAVFPETATRIALFKGSVIGFWALMPAAWYLGGRWLGMDRLTALLFGLLTLAVRDIHAVGFGFTAASYGGLYTQMWGMALLPLTVGAFRRYVVDESIGLVVPVGLFVVLSMSHLFCGMYAGIASLLWVGVASRRRRAFRRTLWVFLPALALLAFWLVPLLATNHLAGGLPWRDEYYNGWPVVELFRHLLGGDVFDWERLPWLTVLVFAGLVAAARREARPFDRWICALGAVTLVLFMGRTNFGGWYDMIPMHDQINVMRYIGGIHFCGLALAAIAGRAALGWIRGRLERQFSRERAGLVLGLGVIVLAVLYGVDRYRTLEPTLKTFDQGHPNVEATLDHLREGPGQRFAVSDELNTAPHFFRDLFPALAGRGQLQSYALGYHATLSTYYADYVRYDRTWARLFNVGEFLAREPFGPRTVRELPETHRSGPYRVYAAGEDPSWGYFDFIRTPISVEGDYRAVRPGVRSLLVPGFERRVLPVLEGATEASSRAGGPLLREPGGEAVQWKSDRPNRWKEALEGATTERPIRSRVRSAARGPNWYEAAVEVAGEGERLMLKVNYFPFWRATVDGEPASIDHVAPNFMAVDVPSGRHRVRFEYRNPRWQKAGFVLTFLILCGWSLREWWKRRT